MNPSIHDKSFDRSADVADAEQTLRLVASLPAPKDLEERVKASLRTGHQRAEVVAWPFPSAGRSWMQNAAMRTGAAAAIVLVIAGGGWEVYSHIQPAAVPTAVSAPQPLSGRGGFSTAGTKRVPQMLDEPPVALPVIEKQKADDAVASRKHGKRTTAKKAARPNPAER